MPVPASARYSAVYLPSTPSPDDLRLLAEPYRAIIVTQLRAILDRTERSEFYPWIDTKIDLLTGEDLPAHDPLLGRDVASGWVQGRGLETIARFALWLAPYGGDRDAEALIQRTRRLAGDLLARLRAARRVNGGHLHFFMGPDGRAFGFAHDRTRRPLVLGADSPYGYSDLFGAKGIYLAAHLLGDDDARSEARAFCLDVYRAILARTFRSDQPQPPSGARAWVDGAFSHGPAMIALGLAALFAECEPGPEPVDLGLALARYVLDNHVNLRGKWTELREFDLVEFVDAGGRPFHDEAGRIISDPGHSLEFAGLFLKFSRAVRRYGGASAAQLQALGEIEPVMPGVLLRAFENGYRHGAGGICKTVDLLAGARWTTRCRGGACPRRSGPRSRAWQSSARSRTGTPVFARSHFRTTPSSTTTCAPRYI